jgi:hypothetical protein
MLARTQNRKRTGQKARIHSGAVGGKQPVWAIPEGAGPQVLYMRLA